MSIPPKLRNTYIRSGEEKLRTLERLWHEAQDRGADQTTLAPLKEFSHRLAGSGGSYGFFDLGDAARSLELAITAAANADATESAYRLLHERLAELAAMPTE